jgi:hypothetical protein
VEELCRDATIGNWLIYVKEISNDILNLKCPHCSAVFLDFTGCCAVTCETCKGEFCGLCQKAEANNSVCHAHVLVCNLNPNNPKDYYCSKEQLDVVHNSTRVKLLRDYFAVKVPKGDIKRKVLSECEKIMADFNITRDQIV